FEALGRLRFRRLTAKSQPYDDAKPWGRKRCDGTYPLVSRSSTDQTGQAPVGEDLAAGLALGAVRDLVGLVGDAAEVVAAAGAGEAGPAVDDEAVAELGG